MHNIINLKTIICKKKNFIKFTIELISHTSIILEFVYSIYIHTIIYDIYIYILHTKYMILQDTYLSII